MSSPLPAPRPLPAPPRAPNGGCEYIAPRPGLRLPGAVCVPLTDFPLTLGWLTGFAKVAPPCERPLPRALWLLTPGRDVNVLLILVSVLRNFGGKRCSAVYCEMRKFPNATFVFAPSEKKQKNEAVRSNDRASKEDCGRLCVCVVTDNYACVRMSGNLQHIVRTQTGYTGSQSSLCSLICYPFSGLDSFRILV
ncbi:hypothetical protein BaRGS_00030442 [Batillaria attramentaria]|uniref:Uncharacterized protein n=1 Tax=Batillaria attramentaria TaxID=370345 RepID=A0ABD0JUI0_9CAEN